MQHIDIRPLGFVRPQRIRWYYHGDRDQCFAGIRSKSLRKFVLRAEENLAANGIRWQYEQLTRQNYLDWLPFYKTRMNARNHDLLASPQWYDEKIAEGKIIRGLFFYKQNLLVGTGIVSQKGTELATLAFKASELLSLSSQSNSSLGSLIDYFFIRACCQEQVATISGGRSYNAFGAQTTLGYLEFKTNFYEPVYIPGEELLTTIPAATAGQPGVAAYVLSGPTTATLRLFVASDTLSTEQLEKQYGTPGIERLLHPYATQLI